MAILKKILAVVGILSVLICSVVVPCSALQIPMANPSEQIYLYAPVTLDLRVGNITPDLDEYDVYVSAGTTEKEELTRSYQANVTLGDGSSIYLGVSNNYIRVPNGGYKGGSAVSITPNNVINPVSTFLEGFRLPSVWAFRTLKTGIQSPHIRLSENASDGPISVRYTCRIYSVKTREEVDYEFTAEITSLSIPVFPVDLGNQPILQGFGNYIIFDYKCEISGASVMVHNALDEAKINIVLPDNGSCGRLIPYASEYGSSYVDKLAKEEVIQVIDEYDLDFTNWLSGAFGWLDVELFGNFTIGGLLATVIGISLFLAFLKIFAGG